MAQELELYHYGKKGMKWGIRKSKKETGISRFSGAAADSHRRTARINEIIGNGQKKVGKIFGASNYGNRAFKKAEKQKQAEARFRTGKATVKDKLGAATLRVSLASMVFERRPRKKKE